MKTLTYGSLFSGTECMSAAAIGLPLVPRRCMGASRLFCPVHQVYVCADECRCSHYAPLTAQRIADRG